MLFCCLWRNVETSCHKHFAVFSHHQQTPPLTTSDVSQLAGRWPWSTGDRVDNTWPVAALTARSKSIYWLRIAISAYLTGLNIAMPFVMEKLEWCGYPVS